MTGPNKKTTIARSLGLFVGAVWKGVTTDPAHHKRVVHHDVETQTEQTDQGKVTLRRTTIEEVEIEEPKKPS